MPAPLIRDVSKYDPVPVPYGDYDGLMIRCWSGTSPDPLFQTHKQGAIAAGKPWWAYSFYNYNYPAPPQVSGALTVLGNDRGNLSLTFDVEGWGGYPLPPRATLLLNMKILYDLYLASIAEKPQWYMNPSLIHYLKPVPQWLLDCPLHVAHWGTTTPDYEPWLRYTFQQYQGEPDLNRFNGTLDEFHASLHNFNPAIDKLAILWREAAKAGWTLTA